MPLERLHLDAVHAKPAPANLVPSAEIQTRVFRVRSAHATSALRSSYPKKSCFKRISSFEFSGKKSRNVVSSRLVFKFVSAPLKSVFAITSSKFYKIKILKNARKKVCGTAATEHSLLWLVIYFDNNEFPVDLAIMWGCFTIQASNVTLQPFAFCKSGIEKNISLVI